MLYYKSLGSSLQVIILIHGLPCNGTMWEGIAEKLAEDYRVIIPDLYGAGKSPSYNGELSLSIMAQAIQDIIVKENINKPIIVGHSMGGYTALECMALFPELIQGISLVNSLASADDEEKKASRLKSISLIQNYEKGKEEFIKGMVPNLFAPEFAKNNPSEIKQVTQLGMELPKEALINFYKAIMNRSDKCSLLSNNTTIPIQWIIGKEDKATPYEIAIKQSYLSSINDIVILNNVGHMSPYEAPELLLKSLSKFCHFCFKQ